MKTMLFRSGTALPASYPKDLQARVAFIDSVRPGGHISRTGALYCAPDIDSLRTWHDSNLQSGPAYIASPHRLWVEDANQLRVYPTLPYEHAVGYFDDYTSGLSSNPEGTLEVARQWATKYWESGILLSDWNKGIRNTDDSQSHWWGLYETLVDPSMVVRRQSIGASWLKANNCNPKHVAFAV